MGIGTAIFLFAVGAILRFAVTTTTTGINLQTVGDILMIVGIAGIILSIFFWGSWGGFGTAAGTRNRRTTVYDDGVPVNRGRVVVDRDESIY